MSDLGVGDAEIPDLTIYPADLDTQAALTVAAPDGTATGVPVTGGPLETVAGTGDLRQLWTATDPVVYTTPGRWVLTWSVTGTGQGTETVEVWVTAAPVAGGPTWAPGLTQVAKHVPRLTVDQTTPGTATELGTFTNATNPTGVVAQQHINDAVAEVTAAAGAVPDVLSALARSVAALRAAASIQRAYANTALGTDTLTIAAALDARADADLARLQAAIIDLGDGAADGVAAVAPVWSFPPPVPWGDQLI